MSNDVKCPKGHLKEIFNFNVTEIKLLALALFMKGSERNFGGRRRYNFMRPCHILF